MSVEIKYREEKREKVTKIVTDLDDITGDIITHDEIEEPENSPHDTVYRVTVEVVAVEEQYIVRTQDGMGKESRTYTIKRNDDGDWEVDQVRKSPNRGHDKIATRGQLSTQTVRDALKYEYGIELVN